MLFNKILPESKSGSFPNENEQIKKIMFAQKDEEIIALADEMGISVEKDPKDPKKLKDKSATIMYLIKGGCPNCGKKKNEKGSS